MLRHILRHLGTAILAGFAAGAVTGLLEVFGYLAVGGNSAVSRTFLLHATLIYGLGWSIALASFAVIAALLTAANREKWGGPETAALHTSTGICLSILVMGGGYANLHFLPSATDLRSLLFDLILMAVCVALFFILNRMGRRVFRHLAREAGLGKLGNVTISCLALLLLTSAAVSYFPEAKDTQDPEGKPTENPVNVVLIVIDTLRADHLSLYGYDRETDPNLKAFARSGATTFLQASAQAPWTKPSVATILTSLHLSSHRANSLGSALPESVSTITEILKARGYRTGFFSANEWISPLFNFDQGVDHFFVNTSSKIDNLIAGHIFDLVSRFSDGIRSLYVQVINIDRFLQTGRFVQPDNIAPVITGKSLAWIEANRDAPFFAYIHYIDPHVP
ncbi:sulfatase-like hydrolase/transferase, partial [Thermodesulfobacteriota bacterium]